MNAKDRKKYRKKLNKANNAKSKYRHEQLDKIRKFNDPILKQVCEPVASGEDVSSIISEMLTVLGESANGVGLAASQIGYLKAIVCVKPLRKKAVVMVNPEILSQSKNTQKVQEGCLSYPGTYVEIERSTEVVVKYQDRSGTTHIKELAGFDARIFLHEYDHTLGICRVADEWIKINGGLEVIT